jgi:hypothetical protein
MTIDASNVVITTTAEEGTDLVTRDADGKILASATTATTATITTTEQYRNITTLHE